MAATATIDASELVKVATLLAGTSQDLRKRWGKAATTAGNRMVNTAKREYRTGGTTATATAVRTGNLRRSLSSVVSDGRRGTELEVGYRRDSEKGNALEYAALQEFGGTIKPKRGQYLTIPLDDALTKAGVARAGIRDYPGGFFYRTDDGRLFYMWEDPRTEELKLLFKLAKSATIPARPSLAPSRDKHMPKLREDIEKTTAVGLRQALRRAKR